MKGKMVIGVILVLFGSMSWYFFGTREHIKNYPPKNETIVVFGDSLVFGQGATKGNDFVSLLEEKLGKEIINLGVNGNTTKDGLLRVDAALKEDPGIVVLLLGGNDYLKRIPIEETEKNLGTLIQAFENNGSVVVLLGVRGGVLQDKRDGMYEELSEKYGTVYVPDVLDGIFLKQELMADGIHPNDNGYSIIAERLVEVFNDKKLIRKPDKTKGAHTDKCCAPVTP